jgi:ferric-dicitrate binding protein FerR (iron transport regulator)
LVFAVGAAATFTVTTLSSPAYATAVGERRIIILSDGSRVELNTNSKIIVRYRNRMRRIELVKGEALFNVAQGAEPLLLKAGATARGRRRHHGARRAGRGDSGARARSAMAPKHGRIYRRQ